MRIRFLFVLLLFCGTNLWSQNTFRGFRFSVGPRAGFALLPILSSSAYKPSGKELLQFGLKTELVLTKQLTLDVNYYREKFNHQIVTDVPLPQLDETSAGSAVFRGNSSSLVQTFSWNIRLYSTRVGYMAPWGRFLSYGIFSSIASHKIDTDTFSGVDGTGERVIFQLPSKQIKTYANNGVRVGFGNKAYVGKKGNLWIEYEFGYALQFRTAQILDPDGRGIKGTLHNYAMYKSQLNHIFQFSFSCGFSI